MVTGDDIYGIKTLPLIASIVPVMRVVSLHLQSIYNFLGHTVRLYFYTCPSIV